LPSFDLDKWVVPSETIDKKSSKGTVDNGVKAGDHFVLMPEEVEDPHEDEDFLLHRAGTPRVFHEFVHRKFSTRPTDR
jgi:hypothetical protein